MNQQTAFNKNYTLHQKKKKMKTGKSCKTIWRNSLPHNMYHTNRPLNTHMFNLCPMTSESPTSFRLCVSRSTICTSLSSLYYSVNCAMLTSRKPAP